MIRTLRLRSLGSIVLFSVSCCAASALAQQAYVQHNLVSDLPGVADRRDTSLVNAWGITHSSTSPWWVNANGTGLSIVVDGNGQPFPAASPIVVAIPPPPAGQSSAPTGIIFNGTADFQMAPGKPAVFVFATEDGTISAWNPTVDATNAVREVNNSGSAVYKGLAMGTMNGANILLAADFHNARIDAFDATFTQVTLPDGAFTDSSIPAGFAPFNVLNVGGSIFVTYAKQDDARHDDVPGAGFGYCDQFSLSGALLAQMKNGPWMNSPWGVAVAPQGFASANSDDILVGNFGSGQIARFKANGEFQDLLRDLRGQPITIDGLWGIGFGNGANAGSPNTLFFAAGIQGEAHGLFGTLTVAPPSNANNGENNGNQGQGQGNGNGNGKDNGKGNGNGNGNGNNGNGNGNGNGKGNDKGKGDDKGGGV